MEILTVGKGPESSFGIPTISNQRLSELAAQIEPLVKKDGLLHHIKKTKTLRNTAFMWSPQLAKPVAELVPFARIDTLHTFGAPVFFKPTVAEVLAQINCLRDDIVPLIRGFEVDEDVKVVGSFHKAVTTLYAKGTDLAKLQTLLGN